MYECFRLGQNNEDDKLCNSLSKLSPDCKFFHFLEPISTFLWKREHDRYVFTTYSGDSKGVGTVRPILPNPFTTYNSFLQQTCFVVYNCAIFNLNFCLWLVARSSALSRMYCVNTALSLIVTTVTENFFLFYFRLIGDSVPWDSELSNMFNMWLVTWYASFPTSCLQCPKK